jgi:hypothetical protein
MDGLLYLKTMKLYINDQIMSSFVDIIFSREGVGSKIGGE